MRTVRRLLLLAVFAALFYAAWQFVGGNGQEVSIELVMLRISVPLWAALLAAFVLGALSAGASLVYEIAKKSYALLRYRKQMAGLESEIHQLRNLPLAAPDAQDGPAPPRGALADGVVRQRS